MPVHVTLPDTINCYDQNPVVTSSNAKVWLDGAGYVHRDDGPAIELPDGTCIWMYHGHLTTARTAIPKYEQRLKDEKKSQVFTGVQKVVDEFKEVWYLNGQKHREDGPAAIYRSGSRIWYRQGNLHREDGPAVMLANGRCEWFVNGLRHRLDGPAITTITGLEEWYKDGKRHRTDGPAVVKNRGWVLEWWMNGCRQDKSPQAAVTWRQNQRAKDSPDLPKIQVELEQINPSADQKGVVEKVLDGLRSGIASIFLSK
jgi:hypothetical protein